MPEKTLYYTGIGSRETPTQVMEEMSRLALQLAPLLTLRSGGADGADTAFEKGCRAGHGPADIYLPWAGFNTSPSGLHEVCTRALQMASTVHPAWENLNRGPQYLHGRNCYQVLGKTLDTPSEFVVCWTADGCESAKQRRKTTGGTATAIVLAERNGIPVFNLANDESRRRLSSLLKERFNVDVSWLCRTPKQEALF